MTEIKTGEQVITVALIGIQTDGFLNSNPSPHTPNPYILLGLTEEKTNFSPFIPKLMGSRTHCSKINSFQNPLFKD